MARRILIFPLTRLLIAIVVFVILGGIFAGLLLPLTLAPGGSIPVGQDFSLPSLLGQLIQVLAAVGTLLFLGKVIERRPLDGFGLRVRRALRDLGLGMLLGAALLTVVVGALALAGWYRVEGFAWDQPGGNAAAIALTGLVLTALIAVGEEVIFRGIFFRIVEEWLGSWIALALSALVFGLLHTGNPNATFWAGIAIALEAGILFGAVYILTRALWAPIGLHWTWNYFEGWVYGTPVSGLEVRGLLRSTTTGPEIWTGGAFGPEAGLVAVIVCTAAGLLILSRCVREGRIVTPPWLARLTVRSSP